MRARGIPIGIVFGQLIYILQQQYNYAAMFDPVYKIERVGWKRAVGILCDFQQKIDVAS